VTLLSPLYAGGSVTIVKGKVSLPAFWELVQKHHANWTSVMPSILSILIRYGRKPESTPLKGIICGGQPLSRSVKDNFENTFGVPIFEGFGLTETTSFACFNEYPAEKRKTGIIGSPLSINDMAIMDENCNELGADKEGEICIRGLNVAVEYLGLPEENHKAFKNDWFHSGDYGYRDEDGYYHFLSRHDALIIKGGENVYPAEIENILFEHPAIIDCAVIGIPDTLLGEEIGAFIKLTDESMTEEVIREYFSGRIAGFKHPKHVFFLHDLDGLDEIPKGPTNKVLYRELRDYYLENLV
ncbi:class I adenylate-forming enzyme family protein, partial [Calditrichota bacterium]